MNFCLSLILLLCLSCTKSTNKVIQKKFLTAVNEVKASGKSRGYFKISFSDKRISNDQLEITAHLTAQQSFSETQIQWQLPDHLSLSQGQLKQQVELRSMEQKSFKITVDPRSLKDGDQIFFFAFKEIRGEKHGGTDSYIYRVASEPIQSKSISVDKKIIE